MFITLKFYKWFFKYNPGRSFPTDMASFAVNARRLIDRPSAIFYHITRHDYEGTFLKELVAWHELEPKADDCTRVILFLVDF